MGLNNKSNCISSHCVSGLSVMSFSSNSAYAEAKTFVKIQGVLRKIICLPDSALDVGLIARAVKLQKTIDFRKQKIKEYVYLELNVYSSVRH